MRNRITQKTKKRKLPALDKYVIFSFACLLIFTAVSIIYQFVSDDAISDSLIIAFFGVFGGELLMLCMIKRLKLKKGEKEDEQTYE